MFKSNLPPHQCINVRSYRPHQRFWCGGLIFRIIALVIIQTFIFTSSAVAYPVLKRDFQVEKDLRVTNADNNPDTIKEIEGALDVVRWTTGKPVDWKTWEWVPDSKHTMIQQKKSPYTIIEKNADGFFPATLVAGMPKETDRKEQVLIEEVRRQIEGIFKEQIGREPTIKEAAEVLRIMREEGKTVKSAGRIAVVMVTNAAYLVENKEHVMEAYKKEGIPTLKEMAAVGEMGWAIENIFIEQIGREPTIKEAAEALKMVRTEERSEEKAGEIVSGMVKKAEILANAEANLAKKKGEIAHRGPGSVNEAIDRAFKEERTEAYAAGTRIVQAYKEEEAFWAKTLPHIRAEYSEAKKTQLKDKANSRAVIIDAELLEYPGLPEALYSINRQLGKQEGIKFVLAIDDLKKEEALYSGIKNATHGRVDLKGVFEMTVPREKEPKEVINNVRAELNVETVEVIGREEWAQDYLTLAKIELEDCIVVICKIKEGKLARGDTALWVALNALVDEQILEAGEPEALLHYRKDGALFVIEAEDIGDKVLTVFNTYHEVVLSE